MTPPQPVASAQDPWTSTTVGFGPDCLVGRPEAPVEAAKASRTLRLRVAGSKARRTRDRAGRSVKLDAIMGIPPLSYAVRGPVRRAFPVPGRGRWRALVPPAHGVRPGP